MYEQILDRAQVNSVRRMMMEVMKSAGQGESTKQIAYDLGLEPVQVETIRSLVLQVTSFDQKDAGPL